MSDRLRAHEPGARGARRILRRELKRAARALKQPGPRGGDDALHDVRKRLKRARAALRLIRPALGDRRYRRENRALRDAARRITMVRDAKVLVDTLDRLAVRAPTRDARTYRRLRPALVRDLERSRRRIRRIGAPDHLGRRLAEARRRLGDWRAPRRGWAVLGRGLERVYRAGRAAFVAAREQRTTERLHEWRKQSKYLWHLLEMLAPARPAVLERREELAHRLSDELGADHDLAVLEDRLSHARLSGGAARRLASAIEQRRRGHQERAVAIGARVFDERPRDYVRRIERFWRLWRAQSAEEKRALRARASRSRAARARGNGTLAVRGRA